MNTLEIVLDYDGETMTGPTIHFSDDCRRRTEHQPAIRCLEENAATLLASLRIGRKGRKANGYWQGKIQYLIHDTNKTIGEVPLAIRYHPRHMSSEKVLSDHPALVALREKLGR